MNPNHHAPPPPTMPRLADLDLRDLFAMAALAGIQKECFAVNVRVDEHAAVEAYRMADFMLAARKEGR